MNTNLSFEEKVEILRMRINRFFDDFSGKWTREDIVKHNLRIEEIMPALREWQKRGFINILDSPQCFFETLKSIPKDWMKERS